MADTSLKCHLPRFPYPQIGWEVIRLGATHMDTVNSKQQVAAMEETEQLSERWQNELPGSFMNSGAYIFFDQYRTVFLFLACGSLVMKG